MSTEHNDPGHGDRLMTHDYDGIREYDNPTPGWWHAIFITSVVFSVLYFLVFHMSPIGDKWEVHARHDAAAKRAAAASLERLGELTSDEAKLMSLSVNEAAVGMGRAVFAGTCATCHRADGGGMPSLGPNFTDDFGKNIKMPEDIYNTIVNGIPGTAMQSWKSQMTEEDMILAAAYVISLRGTNVADGKEPEGERLPEWPAPGLPGE